MPYTYRLRIIGIMVIITVITTAQILERGIEPKTQIGLKV